MTATTEPPSESERLLDLFEKAGRLSAWRIELPERIFRPIRGSFMLMGDVAPGDSVPVADVLARFAPDDRRQLTELFERLLRTGQPVSHRSGLTMLESRPLALHIEALPERDADGTITAVFGITRDITDRVLSERAHADWENRTRAILDAIDAAGIGFCVEDHEGGIFAVSPRLAEIFGVADTHEAVGRRWADMLTLPDHVAALSAEEDQSYADDRPRPFVYPDFELRHPGGRVSHLHARTTPLPGIGRLLLVLDETDRRHMERRQADMDRHLQRVQRLEAVGQLAGGVAHEINNLLHPIRTFARAVGTAENEEDRQRYLKRVLECADKARDIVREMLTFARSSEGSTTEVSLNALVADSVAFSRDLPLRGVEIELGLPEADIRVSVNETEFTQVLLNLLTNAADAMNDEGIVRIQLSAVDLAQGEKPGLSMGRHALISVADDGPGMPPEVLDRIFEPFFTTKEPGKGTGLGLSVVYGIIHHWGGAIEVNSAPGEGTEIVLLLPAQAPDEAAV